MAVSTKEVADTLRQGMGAKQADALAALLVTIASDISAIETSITGITAQLDADAGVTDTDYAANHDPSLTTGA